jgi:hypothetical protein
MILTDHRDLSFDFSDAIDGFDFDQMNPALPNYHGIGAMHRVDFVVELRDAILFVEVKDPSHPSARPEGLESFFAELRDDTLGTTFANKFVDSFFYRWAEDRIDKPIHYVSLVTLEVGLLPNLLDQIKKRLPPIGKPVPRWRRAVLASCLLFNIATWNENFPKWQVRRLSETV